MSSQPLPRESRLFIVLTALLQGLLLWLAETGREHGWWPFSALSGTICWYTLVLGVPGIMTMSVLQLGDRRFWQQAAQPMRNAATLATTARISHATSMATASPTR